MGTRNLTAVMVDGEYKIAQYGQWDGYPSGQGAAALKILKAVDLEKLESAAKDCTFLNNEELEALGGNWQESHPQLSRDNGADILQLVYDGKRELANNIGFAGDSLMCEYAYIVDFDKNSFEVYEGFNKEPVTEGRFIDGDESLESSSSGYHPVKLIKSYSLNNLPSEEHFISDLEPKEED